MEGLDLRDDIDGAAALSAALDLVLSAPTAAAATAASVGTEVWFLTAGRDLAAIGDGRISLVRPDTGLFAGAFRRLGKPDAARRRRTGKIRGG